MRTEVTELAGSRVRVEAAIEPDELARRVQRAARELAREMRLPGFRKGKVPPELVIQRVGREAVLDEALRSSLPEWYEQALIETGITPVGDPKLDVPKLPAELAGKTASFAVTVKEVREKKLPALDDEFAADASEFDTLAELREEIGHRLAAALEQRAEADFREAAVDAAAESAKVEIPAEIVD